MRFLLHRTNCNTLHPCISTRVVLIDPYIRKFARSLDHSNHRYFIDPRHVGNAIHRWTGFVRIYHLRSLSAAFAELLTYSVSCIYASRSLRGSVSGRYPLIPLLGLSVHERLSGLLSIPQYCSCLTFLVRNKSHRTSLQSRRTTPHGWKIHTSSNRADRPHCPPGSVPRRQYRRCRHPARTG